MQDAKQTLLDTVIREGARRGAGRARWLVCSLIAAVAVVALASAAADGADGRGAGVTLRGTEVVVRLYPTAVVSADQITLADLAELEGEVGRGAASWPIAQSPDVGVSRVIDLAHVQKILARNGANLAHWVFRGSTRCTVSRPARSPTDRPGQTVVSSVNSPSDNRSRTARESPSRVSPTSDKSRMDPNTLGGALHAHIRNRLANLGGSPMIEFTPAVMRLLGLSRPTYDFAIEDCSDRLLGMVPLSVTIYEGDQVEQVLRVLARVSLRKPVVVAARQINRGETIRADDLGLEDRAFERVGEIGLTETAALIGQRVTSFLKKGEQVSARDVEPMPLVRRNELVTVIVRGRSLMIRASARALSAGGYGDVVELRNEMAKRSAETYTAIVTGPKTVEVGLTAGGPVAMLSLAKGGF